MEANSDILHIDLHVDENLRALLNDGLIRRINLLMEEKEKLAIRNETVERMYMDQSIELESVKEENEKLYGQLKCQDGKSDYQPVEETQFVVTASRLHFKDSKGNHPSHEWTVSLWLNLNELAEMKYGNNKMLINNAFYVGFVYKVITEDNKLAYRYCGTRNDFAVEWNDNVADRQDKDRRIKLTCKVKSLTAALNKSPYKDVAITDWRILSISGDPNSEQYDIGLQIKNQIESFLKSL